MKWFHRRDKQSHLCQICGTAHSGLTTDFAFMLPDDVLEQDVENRQAHLDWSTDLCGYQDRWFLRCVLEVPLNFREGSFGWGVWVEVSEPSFARYYRVYETDGSNCPRESGTIASSLPYYGETKGLEVEVQFGESDRRPLVFLKPNTECDIARDQRSGISDEQHHAIVKSLHPRKP